MAMKVMMTDDMTLSFPKSVEEAQRLTAQVVSVRFDERARQCLLETFGKTTPEELSSEQQALLALVEEMTLPSLETIEEAARAIETLVETIVRTDEEVLSEEIKIEALEKTMDVARRSLRWAVDKRARLEAADGIIPAPSDADPDSTTEVYTPTDITLMVTEVSWTGCSRAEAHAGLMKDILEEWELTDESKLDTPTLSFVDKFVSMMLDFGYVYSQLSAITEDLKEHLANHELALERERARRQDKKMACDAIMQQLRAALAAIESTQAAIARAKSSDATDTSSPASAAVVPLPLALPLPCVNAATRSVLPFPEMSTIEAQLKASARSVDTIMQRVIQMGSWKPAFIDSTGELHVTIPQVGHDSSGSEAAFPGSALKAALFAERDAAEAVLAQCRSALAAECLYVQGYFSMLLDSMSQLVAKLAECVENVALHLTSEVRLFHSVLNDETEVGSSDVLRWHKAEYSIWQAHDQDQEIVASAASTTSGACLGVWCPHHHETWFRSWTKMSLMQHAATELIIGVLETMATSTPVGHKHAHEGLAFVSELLSLTVRDSAQSTALVRLWTKTAPSELAAASARVCAAKVRLVDTVESFTELVDYVQGREEATIDGKNDAEDDAKDDAEDDVNDDAKDGGGKDKGKDSLEAIKQWALATVWSAPLVALVKTAVSHVERLRDMVAKALHTAEERWCEAQARMTAKCAQLWMGLTAFFE